MRGQSDRLPQETLRRLHRSAIEAPTEIRALLARLQREKIVLNAGINRNSGARIAYIEEIAPNALRLTVDGISQSIHRQLAVNFLADDTRYFFVANTTTRTNGTQLEIAIPNAIYIAERRDQLRAKPAPNSLAPTEVEIAQPDGTPISGIVTDWSYHGIGVEVPPELHARLGTRFRVRYASPNSPAKNSYAEVRSQCRGDLHPGWVRLGLSVSEAARPKLIPIERRSSILGETLRATARSPIHLADKSQADLVVASKIVDISNASGQPMRAIVDVCGDPRGAPAVIIPPAWGRIKETLRPLATSIVQTFQSAGRAISVLRFDGTQRRGESYVDPSSREPGLQHLRFTFGQAVEDLQSCIDFLADAQEFSPSTVILVSFSLSAIESRRVVATNKKNRIGGWVSVVGVADLQSSLHTISGGVDYGFGLMQGLRFGEQELFGTIVDIDRAGLDAMNHGLCFFEDARLDMLNIDVPITWLHGRHDAWVDVHKVRELMSCGDISRRRFVELPIGHQLRTSSDALETFQLISREVGRMALQCDLEPVRPDLDLLAEQIQAERTRLPSETVDLREFWRDYLIGRSGRLGVEILTATSLYRAFMSQQTDALDLQAGDRVADLGSGIGDFLVNLLCRPKYPSRLTVDAIDYVWEAIGRARERVSNLGRRSDTVVRFVVANLDARAEKFSMPVGVASYDAVMASLFLSYVSEPDCFLAEVFRILKPGGRLVLSSLRRDADISKIYVDSLPERYSTRPVEAFGMDRARDLDRLLPSFLNSAARILDLEERGHFRFFDRDELATLVEQAGFSIVEATVGLGDPSQAVIITARRR